MPEAASAGRQQRSARSLLTIPRPASGQAARPEAATVLLLTERLRFVNASM